MNVPSKCISHRQEREAKERSAGIWRLQTSKDQGLEAQQLTKAQLHQELRTLNREMEAFMKGDEIRVSDKKEL